MYTLTLRILQKQNKPDIIKSTFFFFLYSGLGPVGIMSHVKTGAGHESKTSQSVLKDPIPHNKDNKGGFQAVKMFISTPQQLQNHLQLHPFTFCDGCNVRQGVWSEMQVAHWADVVCRVCEVLFPPSYLEPHYHTSGSRRLSETMSVIQRMIQEMCTKSATPNMCRWHKNLGYTHTTKRTIKVWLCFSYKAG